MFSRPDQLDAGFLGDKPYKYWRGYLSMAYGEQMNAKVNTIAPLQISYYLSQIKNLDEKNILKPDPELVREARAALNKEPAVQSIYAGIRKTAGSQLPPLRLENILPPESRDILTSPSGLPGMFTKQGYDSLVKDIIARGGTITDSGDWVLGNTAVQLGSDVTEKRKIIVDKLKQLYMEDYIRTWKEFIGSISITPFKNVDDLVKKIGVLSDDRTSPLVSLANKMTQNMQVEINADNSGIADKGLEFFDKLKGKMGMAQSPEDKKRNSKNVLEMEFIALSTFSGPSEKAGLKNYQEILKKFHEKLYALSLSSNSGEEMKLLAKSLFTQNAFLGGANELNSSVQKTDYILNDFNSRFKDDIGRLLLQTFDRVGEACIRATAEQLDKAWKERVYKVYKVNLAGRYPFSKSSKEEVSKLDLADFFMPSDGVAWQFYDGELKPFLDMENGRLRPKRWKNVSVPFSAEFLRFYEGAGVIKESLFWKNKRTPELRFWIRPHPPKSAKSNVSKTIFSINGQELIYNNGPELWESFAWPGNKLEQEGLAPRTSLEISRGAGGYRSKKEFDGEWSFFRLLDAAEVVTDDRKFFNLKWTFQLEGETVIVNADLKTESLQNPFGPGFFSSSVCPEQLISLSN